MENEETEKNAQSESQGPDLFTRVADLEAKIAAIEKWEVTQHPASKEYILNKKG